MEAKCVRYYRFKALLLQQGWLEPGYVGIDENGNVGYLSDEAPQNAAAIDSVSGLAVPGFPNAHSHAFQFAMAGMAEKHQPGAKDDFWSWREGMYECALNMDADQMEAVAAMLYSEMLRRGYTHVAEFHYLHHDGDGKPYGNPAETGERLMAAAKKAGIRITLVPVFYQKGGFGRDAEPRQRRFITTSTDEYLKLLEAYHSVVSRYRFASLGFGVHSLRAVSPPDVIRAFENGPRDLPFHMHASEQLKEVEDSLAFLGARPVEWLLENLPLHERFNLVHCTHLNDDETKRLAKSGANVVLCPGTEANLGDGIFRLREFADHYGNWCIGTDSHISLNPMEDLRWLDYMQRLVSHKRNTFDDAATVLFAKVIPVGRKAMGLPDQNFFELKKPFDAVVYDANAPLLNRARREHLLPSLLYTSDPSAISGTIVDGSWVVRNNVAQNCEGIRRAFEKTMVELSQKKR